MTESSRRTGTHRVRLLYRPGEPIEGLEAALRAAESADETVRYAGGYSVADYPDDSRPVGGIELVVLSPGLAQSASDLQELRERVPNAAYLVVASSAAGWEEWLHRDSIGFVRAEATPVEWVLALNTVVAMTERERRLRDQVETIQRRLEDRIFLERAKGVLAQRLGLSEEEAYRRIHTQARRQRRPMREVAQALLDAHSLLQPANGSRGSEAAEAR